MNFDYNSAYVLPTFKVTTAPFFIFGLIFGFDFFFENEIRKNIKFGNRSSSQNCSYQFRDIASHYHSQSQTLSTFIKQVCFMLIELL